MPIPSMCASSAGSGLRTSGEDDRYEAGESTTLERRPSILLRPYALRLLDDLTCCYSPGDFDPDPLDPLWEPSARDIVRHGPLAGISVRGECDPTNPGPRRFAEFHDATGSLPSFEIYQGDAIEVLRHPAVQAVVHAVVTSVPYFRLRRYGDRPEELGWGSLDSYLAAICDVFDAVPLHPRGSVWVNIGDSRDKRGSLIGVPSHFLRAMQERGWMVPDEVSWVKAVAHIDGTVDGNFMPEPAPGRLNGNGHESLYRFVRGQGHRRGGLGKVQDA